MFRFICQHSLTNNVYVYAYDDAIQKKGVNHMDDDLMLTTIDNPYSPFEQFALWYLYDMEKGYNTCGTLDRLTKITDDMSQKEQNDEIDKAMDKLVNLNPHLYLFCTPGSAIA